ncbi:MAG: DNRLRE domain-containing protein [Acidimicrobiales bacterium]|nr:DNRLRE domain-containing protein [Acidimicrobiales bacterium]
MVLRRLLGAAALAVPMSLVGTLPVSADTQTVAVSIAASDDDAEQRADGSVTLTSSDLELTGENGAAQTVGMRFANLIVPAGALVVSAEIQFTVDEATSGTTSLTFRAEATDNAAPFTTTVNSITARPVTTAATTWAPSPWPTVGERGSAQRTPNLAPVVQSIINRPGWQSGNALAIIVTGTGSRVAESFNGSAGSAATLHVEFDFSAPAPPVITSFAPSSSQVGGEVVVTGSGFTGVTAVQVNGVSAAFSATSDTSITVTVPVGSTNGPISVSNSAGTAVSSVDLTIDPTPPLRVPSDFPTIQGAIDASQDGDVIIVAPGTYHESVVISGKNITLASQYLENPDPSLIDATVIDTDGTEDAIIVSNTDGTGPTIMGLKLLNPTSARLDGIRLDGSASILDNHIVQFDDAVDTDSPIGSVTSNCICLRNILELGTDDGFDLDGASGGIYEDNILRDNRGDGVEIRLGDAAQQIDLVFRNNHILRNRQDGIQIIDEPGASNRVFTIERNRFIDNGQAGIGLMDNSETTEDYRAASLTDRINLFNNTFYINDHGFSGGDNVIALNNIFANSSDIAVKNVDGGSQLAHNLFWNNGTDNSGSNLDPVTTLSSDPLFNTEYGLSAGSPAIDAGVASYTWNGELVLDLPPTAYDGSAPDLGAVEFDTVGPQTTITSGPESPSGSPDASFGFTSSIGGSTFECRLDGASFSDCTSPTPYTGLADGTHTFEVRAIDPGGNQDNSPASAMWTIDTTAPLAPTITEPAEAAAVTNGTFTVRGAAEAGSTVTVLVGGIQQSVTVANGNGAWATVVNGLSVGAHVITATAADAVDNQSPSSPGRSISVVASTLSPVIASAGDIACDRVGTTDCRQIATSDLILAGNYDAVLTLGDHQYECASTSEFAIGYEPSWGRVKSITRPAVGNHEYLTTGGIDCDPTGTAADYFNYFGAAAGSPSEGWYSYDLGDWHLISLNSNCSKIGGCGPGSPQEQWLRADLAANPTACSVAYWHDPRWSSGAAHGSNTATAALVDALYENGVDLILAGHDHHYERFAPQAPDGTADPQYGIREFVVGTGGRSVRALGPIEANSEFQWATEFGILELTLGTGSYDWAFLTESGATPDSGSAPCHGTPGSETPPETTISSGPSDPSPSPDATFVFSANEPATFECSLDGETPTACASPAMFTGLSDGPHTFSVTATDNSGELDPTPATWEWSVDTAVPVTVTIAATDPDAGESGTDPGQFTISRDGATGGPLTVQLDIDGTATSDSDYAALPTSIEIPTSQSSAVITVEPIDDSESESTETVIMSIVADGAYTIGTPGSETVSIADNDDPPAGQEITLVPVADTWVDESSPTTNFGTDQTLNVDGNANRAEEALLRFDVNGIAGSAQSAKLRVFVTNATSNGPTVVLTETTWSESAVTWNTKPNPIGGIIDDAGSIPSGAYFEFDVTAAITGPGTYSFALLPQSTNGLGFRSKEAATSPPELVITAPVGPDTEPPSVTSLNPADGASDVSPSAPVQVVFSEAMDPATITNTSLSLSTGGQPVTGAVSYAASSRTATFTPSSPLVLGQTYDANLAVTVTDTSGNPLANPVSWSFSVISSLPTEVTLTPEADTYVNGSRVTTNFGSLSTIESDGASQVEQPLLRFDVSGVASVESAVLRIFVSNSTSNGPEVYLADNNWDENTVTWATRPAQLSGPHVDSGVIGSGWYELDVTAAITTPGVYTLNLVSVSSDGLRFSSREGTDPPQLVVTSG